MYQLMGLCYLILLFKFSLNLFSLFFKIMSFYCFLSLKKGKKELKDYLWSVNYSANGMMLSFSEVFDQLTRHLNSS